MLAPCRRLRSLSRSATLVHGCNRNSLTSAVRSAASAASAVLPGCSVCNRLIISWRPPVVREPLHRVWAVEGCNGIGKHIAHRLVHDGETVLDVPAMLSAQVRVFANGNGRKSDPVDAHSVAMGAAAVYGDAAYGAGEVLDRLDTAGIEARGRRSSHPSHPAERSPKTGSTSAWRRTGHLPQRVHRRESLTAITRCSSLTWTSAMAEP
jgi:hypothetical protein